MAWLIVTNSEFSLGHDVFIRFKGYLSPLKDRNKEGEVEQVV